MKTVDYRQIKIRYWTCPNCDFENRTEISPEDYTSPACDRCCVLYEWGDEEI